MARKTEHIVVINQQKVFVQTTLVIFYTSVKKVLKLTIQNKLQRPSVNIFIILYLI